MVIHEKVIKEGSNAFALNSITDFVRTAFWTVQIYLRELIWNNYMHICNSHAGLLQYAGGLMMSVLSNNSWHFIQINHDYYMTPRAPSCRPGLHYWTYWASTSASNIPPMPPSAHPVTLRDTVIWEQMYLKF